MTETPITWPPGRYGRRRERKRGSRAATIVASVVVAVLATSIGVMLFRAYGEGDYSASVTRFGEITDSQVVVTFQVRLPPGGKAVCVVRARDRAGAETGREEITVSAGSDPQRTEVTHRLVTEDRPVTGEVQGCRPA